MMRKILPILLATAVYLTPLYPVYAQNGATPSDAAMNAPLQPAPVKRIAKPAAASAAAKLDAARDKAMEKKDAAMERIDAMKEKAATRAAQLRAKLARFKDKTKATRVENINTNLNTINERRTTQMQAALTRISAVLDKLKTWVAEQEAAGKDVSALKTAITNTETTWAEADAAVKAQVGNDYTIEVNTESTVKTDAKSARDDLHTDLKMVHDKIVSLRQTLATALGSWRGNN